MDLSFGEPLAQLRFFLFGELTHNAEFVYLDLVQPFGDDDGIVPEFETQRTDVIHLRECMGHFLVFTYVDIKFHMFVFFLQTSDFI